MGWKQVKEHYKIEHIVHVTKEGLCVGSGYIPNLIVIDPESGKIVKRPDWATNDNIDRYIAEMDSDPEKLKELIHAEDKFERSITVYTHDDGELLEKKCEELGWPNVTHDGMLMYGNEFSTDRSIILRQAIAITCSWIKVHSNNLGVRLDLAVQEASKMRSEIDHSIANLEKLLAK